MTDKITSTITDDALDKIVSGTLDDINEDAFNSIKEMFNKDIVTGLYRFIEAVFVAVALAGGYALALIVAGGVLL